MNLNPTQGGERKKSRRSWRILTVKPQFRAFRCGRNIVNMPPKNTLVVAENSFQYILPLLELVGSTGQ